MGRPTHDGGESLSYIHAKRTAREQTARASKPRLRGPLVAPACAATCGKPSARTTSPRAPSSYVVCGTIWHQTVKHSPGDQIPSPCGKALPEPSFADVNSMHSVQSWSQAHRRKVYAVDRHAGGRRNEKYTGWADGPRHRISSSAGA